MSLTKATASLQPAKVEKRWIVIDAEDAVVGRLASFIAMRLRGKHRPDYTPHVDCGDYVVVVNVGCVRFSGRKLDDKVYYRHTGHPGGVKKRTPRDILSGPYPERALTDAVERMLPKESPLARRQLKHLLVYRGAEHPHQAQCPDYIDFAGRNRKNLRGRIHPNFYRYTNRPDAFEEGMDLASPAGMDAIHAKVEQYLMDLDSDRDAARREGLEGLTWLLPQIDLKRSIEHPSLRVALRRTPNRLVRALSENLVNSQTAKAAATALVVSLHPARYRDLDLEWNEEKLLQDFEAFLRKHQVSYFTTVSISSKSKTSAKIETRLWSRLPFQFASRHPRLARSLITERGQHFSVDVVGAARVNARAQIAPQSDDRGIQGVSVTLSPANESDDRVTLYLKQNNEVFERYVYRRSAVFGL